MGAQEKETQSMLNQTLLPVILEKTKSKITPRAGLILIEKVAKELEVDQLLSLHFGHLKKRNKGLLVSRQIMDTALMLIDGGNRIEDIRQFKDDQAWQEIRGMDQAMAPRTARDLLYRFDEESLRQFEIMESRLTHRMTKRLKPSDTATIDADATFIEAHKEEAEMSYHGAPGYYPMLGFWAERAMAIQGEFRAGNETPSSKALAFLKKCAGGLPKGIKHKRLRADAAWFNHEVMDYCQDNNISFAIGGTRNPAMMQAIEVIPKENWEKWTEDPDVLAKHPEQKDWEISQTVYSFNEGSHAYRVVVIRKPWYQLDIFKGIIYDYDIVVTNMDLEKRALVRWYWERCTSENWLKELKYGFGLNQFPCSADLPNGAYFHIVVLAYNLVQALKLLKLDERWRYLSIKTLRYHLFHVAGLVIQHARQLFLKLYHQYCHFDLFHKILYQPAG